MSRIDPKFGFVLFDRELSSDQLTAKGSGTRDSAYTEAGPVPGRADDSASWRPRVSRAQGVGITVGTVVGGYPGRTGAQAIVRLGSETDPGDWRAWSDPVLVTAWSAPSDGWGSSIAYTDYAATVIPASGLIVIVAMDASNSDAQTWSYDPLTDTWTTLYDWDSGALDGLQAPIALTYDEANERLLLWSGTDDYRGAAGFAMAVAYYSDDGGTTWARYSQGVVYGQTGLGASSGTEMSVAQGDGTDWMLCTQRFTLHQWSSSDRGVTWSDVGAVSLARGRCVFGPAGFALIGVDTSDSDKLKCLRAASASGALSSEVTISSTRAYTSAVACVDDDGTIYVVAQGKTGTEVGSLWAFRSSDGGVTWTEYDWGVYQSSSATTYLVPLQLIAAAGTICLVTTTTGTSNTDHTVQVIRLGGWANVAHGVGTYYGLTAYRFGWGEPGSSADAWSAAYVPISAPGNIGWTASGATGTASTTAAEPSLKITCTAGQAQDYFASGITDTADHVAVEAILKLDASGNVTLATLGSAGNGVYLSAFLSDVATYYYEARIDFGSDGMQLRETKTPTVLATQALDMTADYVHVRLQVTKGTATAWYSTDHGRTWARWANAVTIPNWAVAAAGNDGVFFGNKSTQPGVAYWRFVGAAGDADWNYGIDGLSDLGSTAADGVRGHLLSHPVPGAGGGVAIPFAAETAGEIPLLSGTGGPIRQGETVDLPVGHEYPIEALDPLLYPSPRRTWRSTSDASDVKLVYDHGANQESWHGGALALLVIGGTPRQWVLEQDDGSTGWTTLATLDLALGTGLKWIRTGRVVTVDTSSSAIGRYIQEGELVGGYFDLDGDARRISANSGGFWADATTQKIRITLEGVDGTEASSGTAGVLVAPSGLLVYYPTTYLARRYLRVRVSGGAATPDGDYRAGIAAVGRVVGIGTTPGWGWSVAHQQVVSEATASDGVVTRKQLGPPKRVLQYTFSEPSLLQFLHGDSTGADYVAASGALPIGTGQDAPLVLPALLESLRSGEIPCVAVPRLPSTTGTLLNPASWVYGRIRSDLTVTSQQSGTEFVDEALTVSTLTIEEIR